MAALTDSDIDSIMVPQGNGLVFARVGFSANTRTFVASWWSRVDASLDSANCPLVYVRVNRTNTIVGGRLYLGGYGNGSAAIQVVAGPVANWDTLTAANSITGGNNPRITNGTFAQDTTLAGWSKTIPANSAVGFRIASVTNARALSLHFLIANYL